MATSEWKLPAALEKFVAAQVKRGAYPSRQAAIIAAVSQEKRRAEQRAWLEAALQEGLDSGPSGPLDIEDVIRRGRARSAARKSRSRA